MGYTHYWTDFGGGSTLPAEAVKLIKEVTDQAYRQGLIQREYDDSRPPIVNAQKLRFNGVGEAGHETFRYSTSPGDEIGFCKTARKPYDAVVMRVLLILGYCREGLTIRSDGEFDDEWADALAWFNREVGHAYVDRHLGFHRPSTEQTISIPDLCF
jgi:hypothetical protein